MCTTHPFCCSWQKKASTSSLELWQGNWTLLILIQVSFSAALSALSQLCLLIYSISAQDFHSYVEWLSPKHSSTRIILSHINRLLLTLVFLLSCANFSSWAASIFSKSWCFFSSSSTSDTESWTEKWPDTVVLNQAKQTRLCLWPFYLDKWWLWNGCN